MKSPVAAAKQRYLVSLAALLAPIAVGQGISAQVLERFELYNGCRPMGLVVEEITDRAREIRLTEGAIRRAAESRLRAARLFDAGSLHSWMYVDAHVVGAAFSVSVRYHKRTADSFGMIGWPATWHSGITGTHGADAGFIVSQLSLLLDEFLADYLRVNEEDCGRPSSQP